MPRNGVCRWGNECRDYWAQLSTNNVEMMYENNLPSYMSTTSRYAPSEEALVVRITHISATDINNEKENI